MPTAHRIRRLRWRVRAGSRNAAFEVRTRLRQFHQEDLLEVFERAFDAAGVGDRVVHLERLELAVRVPTIDGIADALAGALARETFTTAAPSAPLTPDHSAADPAAPAAEPAVSGVLGLIEYLRTGVLPWPLANLGRQTTSQELAQLAIEHRDRVAHTIPVTVDDAVPYLFRWLQITMPGQWTPIARLIGGSGPDVVEAIAGTAAMVTGSQRQLPGMTPVSAAAAILAVAHVDQHATPVTAHQLSVLFAPVIAAAAASVPETTAAMRTLQADVVTAWIASRLEKARVSAGEGVRTESIDAPPARQDAMPSMTPVRTSEEAPAQRAEGHARDRVHDDDPPGLVVDHAGLVVLHPFLPRLFERLGVASQGSRSIDDAMLPRAAALLAYAALGDDNSLDFELGLIKVLLGLRPDTVLLTPAGTLSDADRNEVDALLHSVIEHWHVLKHTSIAGLRGSFLQRRGMLAAIDEGWRLRVEPDSFDMLIDRLPWALGPIKLPWMTTLLFTEWARS